MIEIEGLIKNYGLRPILRGLNLSVAEGEFLTVFGPNGAGKTTLLRILTSLSRPSQGRVTIGGWELPAEADRVRRQLGVVSHLPLLYGDLTAEENLRFYGRMYAVENLENRILEVLQRVGLSSRRREPVRAFSRGMVQRLAIARAIIHDPAVMLFDEPYTGLDQDSAAMLDELLAEVAAQGRTVVMTTHDLARGLALSTHIAILTRGQIVYKSPSTGIDPAELPDVYAEYTGSTWMH
jgi:heme exporter protein A